ncbi:MAG: hypothetical protein R3246_16725 [Acidimicrobiia bacterium]|nr:hypothetical protein [Acidimicrobiia bacterium]
MSGPTGRGLHRTVRSVVLVSALAAALVLGVVAAASGSVQGGCWGTATIDGVTYDPTYDTRDNPVKIPWDEDGVLIPWEGEVMFANQDHSGKVSLVVGPFNIKVADWEGDNQDDDRTADGTYALDDAKDVVPFSIAGIYKVKAEHSAAGGSCRGFVFVDVGGNPLTSPFGILAVVGTLLGGAGIVAAAFPRSRA